jgi:hypothetical protein
MHLAKLFIVAPGMVQLLQNHPVWVPEMLESRNQAQDSEGII